MVAHSCNAASGELELWTLVEWEPLDRPGHVDLVSALSLVSTWATSGSRRCPCGMMSWVRVRLDTEQLKLATRGSSRTALVSGCVHPAHSSTGTQFFDRQQSRDATKRLNVREQKK